MSKPAGQLPEAIRAAIAPYAPPQSSVHQASPVTYGGVVYADKKSAAAARDNQERAEKLDMQWAEAMRLGGWWL